MAKKQYEVVIKLISNQQPCHPGHKIGDELVFNRFTPPGMCGMAFNTIYPVALALSTGVTPLAGRPGCNYSCLPGPRRA